MRARKIVISLLLLAPLAGCSREQQDWRSAESADTIEAYGQFIDGHPDSELDTQARTRITQLGEQQDWQAAGSADTVAAYRQYLAQHPNGKWSPEARIRLENFTLGAAAAFSPAVTALNPLPAQAPPAQATAPLAAALPGNGKTAELPSVNSAASIAPPVAGVRPMEKFGIQLGAFGSQATADGQWSVLQGRFLAALQGLPHRVVAVDTPNGPLFRLQAVVSGEAQARQLCAELKARGQGCVPVIP